MAAFNSKVEIEFTSGVWTDVSQWVEGFDTSRGRSYEFDEIETGTGSLQLNNADGRFTPGRATSPYYPNVKPRRRVRVSTDVSGTVTPVFNGWVEKWPVVVNQGHSSVTATLSDDLAAFARRKVDKPYLHEWIKSLSPDYYWPMSEPPEATAVEDFAPGNMPLRLESNQYGTAQAGGAGFFASGERDVGASVVSQWSAPVWDPGASFGPFVGRLQADTFPYRLAPTGSSAWAVIGLVDISGVPTSGQTRVLTLAYGAGAQIDESQILEFNMRRTGALSGQYTCIVPSTSGGGPNAYTGIVPFSVDDSVIIVGIIYDPVNLPGKMRVLFGDDGVDVTLGASTFFTGPWPTIRLGHYNGTASGSIAFSNWALWAPTGAPLPVELTNGTYTTQLKEFMDGQVSRSVSSALEDLCRMTGTTADIGVDPTEIAYSEPDPNTSVLEIARRWSDSVDGLLFATAAGGTPRIKYVPRSARFAPGPAVITFRDSTGSSPEPGLTFDSDEARILNTVTVTRPGMATMSATDAASEAEFGPINQDIESLVIDDAVAQGMADWRIYLRKQPQVRCDQAEFNLTASGINPTLFAGLDIGSRVDIAELPDASPFTSAQFFVEGIAFKCTKSGEVEEWSATLQLSPAEPWGVWVVEDNTYGFLDSANAVLSY